MKKERKIVFLGLIDVESVINMNERFNFLSYRIFIGLIC